ncbi:hypothetical protein QUF50_00390 [Thiotrichales bacterium HSG1]|nr:hypothetical protein [Thiotrichales bacterium HSG1]
MPDYKKLLELLEKTEQLEKYAESQIELYNESIKHSLCNTDHEREPCKITDKGEPLCNQTLDASSLLKIAMNNLEEGIYIPATKGSNALPGQNKIMTKSNEEQKQFVFDAVLLAIENCVKCFPMFCRINIYQQINSPCYMLYAKKKRKEYNLNLPPDELIEITINKRLLNPSVCFPRPNTKETLKAFIYRHIKGCAQDNLKKMGSINDIDSSTISDDKSTELLIILQDLFEQIGNEIDSISNPNSDIQERIQKFFAALKSGEIDLIEDNDEEIAEKLDINKRQYIYFRDEYFKFIVTSLITLKELEDLCVKLKGIYIEPSNEND